MRIEMMSLVKDMGLTALYVTHDQVEAMSMSDEIVVMRKGEVLRRGTPEMIYETPSHPFVASFIGKSNWLTVDHSMVRPEHVTWSRTSTEDVCYQATVLSVSYVGERYEIRLQVEGLDKWTAYLDKRVPVGERVNLYVSPHKVCRMGEVTSPDKNTDMHQNTAKRTPVSRRLNEGELGRNESIEVTEKKRDAVAGICHESKSVWMRQYPKWGFRYYAGAGYRQIICIREYASRRQARSIQRRSSKACRQYRERF